MQGAAIGLDIGGTKIVGIVMSAQGNVLAEARAASEPDDYTAHLLAISDVVSALADQLDGHAPDLPVGISQAGLIRDGGDDILSYNLPCLSDGKLRSDLAEKLGRRVFIVNDATAFTLSEMQDGAATDAQRPLGVILGTGIGGGLVLRLPGGGIETDTQASWGEMAAPGSDPGQMITLAEVIAGPVLEQQWRDSGGDGQPLATEIGALARTGDELALRLMDRWWWHMGLGLGNAVNMLSPDLIVFGGSLSRMPGLLDEMALRIPRHTVGFLPGPPLKLAKHGPESGARGAAWLARQQGS